MKYDMSIKQTKQTARLAVFALAPYTTGAGQCLSIVSARSKQGVC